MNYDSLTKIVDTIDGFVWGPAMLVLLVGTGIVLTIRTRFLPWRNLPYAIKSTLSKEARRSDGGEGDVSPFSALTTALAATIGTGNIVGVATAMASGGPGALVWMWISACFGLSSKFAECMLAIKYREVNEKGEMSGGPMYTMKKALPAGLGSVLAVLFAVFTVVASFGIGNMTQANSISSAVNGTAGAPKAAIGIILTILTLIIVVGGIKSISRVSSVIVPIMAVFYVIAGLLVIFGNFANVPAGIVMIFKYAFSVRAVTGGVLGQVVASMMAAMRFGIARGCFSNEAGLGSAAIPAAAAKTDHYVNQGYINMTGTFWDTIVVCTITGLCIASSGMLGQIDPATGKIFTGSALTIAAFRTVLGETGAWLVTIGIALFAFSTILGWEYYGEKAFEYLFSRKLCVIYRVVFSCVVFFGATMNLDLAWTLSDIANALMAIPNLICLNMLSGEVAREMFDFQEYLTGRRATMHADPSRR